MIANDAATLPASLSGRHLPSRCAIDTPGGPGSLPRDDVREFAAIAFGEGDFTLNRADQRRHPGARRSPRIRPAFATVLQTLGHPRLIRIGFDGTPDEIWAGLARRGRPIQYAHVPEPLALWDVWTAIAGPPVAFEPPSAGFVLDWQTLGAMRARRIEFATLTHAAGISSTGDERLDALLPFDEPYDIPWTTVSAIESARLEGRRVVAVGTTVVRAPEHAAGIDGRLHSGPGRRINESVQKPG